MSEARGRVKKGGLDAKGRPRKFVEIRSLYYDDFGFGQDVIIIPVKKGPRSLPGRVSQCNMLEK